jgi:hypothetical protein
LFCLLLLLGNLRFFFNSTVASRPTVISTVRFSTVLRDFDPYVNFTVDFAVEFEFGF